MSQSWNEKMEALKAHRAAGLLTDDQFQAESKTLYAELEDRPGQVTGELDTENVIRKAEKLHKFAEDAYKQGQHAEAESYATKMRELLATYKLSMTDLDFQRNLQKEPVGKSHVFWSEHGLQNKRRRSAWIEDLARSVCKAYGCIFLVREGSNVITIVGRESSRKVAEYTLVTLVRSAEKLAQTEYDRFWWTCEKAGTPWKAQGFKASFLRSFIARIDQRLEDEMRSGVQASTAIVRFETEYREACEWVEGNVKGSAGALVRSYDGNRAGHQRGTEVADSMDLKGNGLEEGEKQTKVLPV